MRPLMLPQSASSLLALVLIALAGCGTGFPGGHSPGERSLRSANRVWRDYDCGTRRLPFVEVNGLEVTPASVAPGTSFTQRLVYSACLPQSRVELPVRVRTRIYHNGQEILTDVQPQFILRPGRWAVDATVTTPPTARPGGYTLRVDITGAVSAYGTPRFDVRH
jgi:hypothetical protein